MSDADHSLLKILEKNTFLGSQTTSIRSLPANTPTEDTHAILPFTLYSKKNEKKKCNILVKLQEVDCAVY